VRYSADDLNEQTKLYPALSLHSEQGAQFFEVGSELDFIRGGATELIQSHRKAFRK
jgi:hypothetical protein